MADFSWLDEIPDDKWGVLKEGHFKSFGLKEFLDRSDAAMPDLVLFEAWASSRPRSYAAEIPQALSSGAPQIVMVVWPSK
ncbi:hypothetical protein [Stenotrophomonas muris]|uniref:hypothetical protein n=1 Tax=Stenotrophomonas muris TaxID=2963283 RepID=UPI00320A25FA